MFALTAMMLLLAVASGVVGYGGFVLQLASVAQVLFTVFVVLFLLSAVASVVREQPPA